MPEPLDAILAQLPRIRAAAQGMQDIVLANLAAIGEVPAPAGREEARAAAVLERFQECGLQNCAADDAGNALGLLPGTDGQTHVLLFSNVDTLLDPHAEPTLSLRPDEIIGPFVGDNALALAVLASLPSGSVE